MLPSPWAAAAAASQQWCSVRGAHCDTQHGTFPPPSVPPPPAACPATCQASLGCQCATTTPPGSLANGDVPQFIVLTNDDAITVVSQPIILNITERHRNKNGCKMPATWFVSVQYTDPNLVKQVFVRGHGEPAVVKPMGSPWCSRAAACPGFKQGAAGASARGPGEGPNCPDAAHTHHLHPPPLPCLPALQRLPHTP
jgi:hypothetical protein